MLRFSLLLFLLTVATLSAQEKTTPIFDACVKGDVAAASSLLAKISPPGTRTEEAKGCLEIAALNGHVDLAKFLLSSKTPVDGFGGWTPLHATTVYAWDTCLQVARLLIAAGADVNLTTRVPRSGVGAGLTPIGVALVMREKSSFGVAGHDALIAFLKASGGK